MRKHVIPCLVNVADGERSRHFDRMSGAERGERLQLFDFRPICCGETFLANKDPIL